MAFLQSTKRAAQLLEFIVCTKSKKRKKFTKTRKKKPKKHERIIFNFLDNFRKRFIQRTLEKKSRCTSTCQYLFKKKNRKGTSCIKRSKFTERTSWRSCCNWSQKNNKIKIHFTVNDKRFLFLFFFVAILFAFFVWLFFFCIFSFFYFPFINCYLGIQSFVRREDERKISDEKKDEKIPEKANEKKPKGTTKLKLPNHKENRP